MPTVDYRGFPDLVHRELIRARNLYPRPIISWSEGYAVILEEVDEFWAEVKKKAHLQSRLALLEELIQVGAMAQRVAEDLGLTFTSEEL